MKRNLLSILAAMLPLLCMAQESETVSTPLGGISLTLILILIIILLINFFLSIFIPMKMAKNRGRSGCLWLVLSWCIGFWWVVLILLIVGDSDEKRQEKLAKKQEKEAQKQAAKAAKLAEKEGRTAEAEEVKPYDNYQK